MRWSCLVAALCTLLLACGGSDVHDKGPGAELAQGARPLRAASSEPPSAPGAAVTADVVTTRGELTVSFALPKLPSRAGLDPQLTLSHDGSAVDLGSGFGAGFSLGVPSIRASTEYGLTLPRNRAAPDPLGTPLTYQGSRLLFVGSSDGQVATYRPEVSEASTRVYYHQTLTSLAVIGGQRLSFQGLLVVHADGRREVYSEDAELAEQDVSQTPNGRAFVTTRFPLQYQIAPSGDYIEYRYTKIAEDSRAYLTSVIFAGGRARYDLELARIPDAPDRPVYDQGFAQRQNHLYTKLTARFDRQVMHRIYPVYRVASKEGHDLLSHAQVAPIAQTTLGAAAQGSPLSEDSVLVGLLRYGRGADDALVTPATPHLPPIRFGYADRTLRDLRTQTHVQTLALEGVTGFGEQHGAEYVDVDQDGLLDIVSTSADRSTTAVYLNEGSAPDGGFRRGGDLTVSSDVQRTASVPSFRGGDLSVWLAGEFDGDGVGDLLQIARASSEGSGSVLTLHPGQIAGAGFYRPASGSHASTRDIGVFRDGRAQIVDLNLDGRDDLVIAERRDGQWRFSVLLNLTKSRGREGGGQLAFADYDAKFAAPSLFDDPSLAGADLSLAAPESRLADVNGDGLVDLAYLRMTSAGEKGLCVFENRGVLRANVDLGVARAKDPVLFGEATSASPTCPGGYFVAIDRVDYLAAANALWLIDLTGDGLSDLVNVVVHADRTSGDRSNRLAVWIGRGREGFRYQGELQVEVDVRVDAVNRWNTRVLDVDGDGQDEIAVYEVGGEREPRLQVIDFNRVDAKNLVAPRALIEVREGKGLAHLVQYATSTDELLRDRAHAGRVSPGIPFVVPLVKRLLTQVAHAPTQVREYRYHGASTNLVERGLLGFARVEIAEYGDDQTAGALTELAFVRTGDAFRDRVLGEREQSRVVSSLPAGPATRELLESLDAAPRDGPPPLAFVSQTRETRSAPPLSPGARLSEVASRWDSDVPATGQRAALYVRQTASDRAEFGAVCRAASCAAARQTVRFEHDGCNRVQREILTEAAVSGPNGLDLPERQELTETAYVSSCDAVAPGASHPLALASVRALRRTSASGRTLEQVELTYAQSPFVPSAVTSRASIDTEGLEPALVAAIKPVPAGTVHFAHDDYLNVVSSHDEPAGDPSRRQLLEATDFDGSGVRVTRTRNGLGHAQSFAYTPEALEPTTLTTAQGDVVTRVYDELQRLGTSTQRDGTTTHYAYREAEDVPTRRVLVSEARSPTETNATLHVQRADGLPLVRIEPGEADQVRASEHSEYGRRGLPIRARLPYLSGTGVRAMFEAPSDAAWQPPGAQPCGRGQVSCTSYDALGRSVHLQAASGRYREDTRYEAWGRHLEVADEAGTRARSTVARGENVFGLVDEAGHLHRFERDEADSLKAVRLAGESEPRTVVADSLGRVLYSAMAHGMRKVFERDHRGRVVREQILDHALHTGGSLHTAHDALDRPVQRESVGADGEPLDTLRWIYDAAEGSTQREVGTLVRAEAYDALAKSRFVESFDHDREGRVTRRRASYERGATKRTYEEAWVYTFDGQLTSYTDPFGNRFADTLTPSGRVGVSRWESARGSAVLARATAFDVFGHAIHVERPAHHLTQSVSYDPASGLLTSMRVCSEGEADCPQDDTWTRRGDGRVSARKTTDFDATYAYTDRGELSRATVGDRAYTYACDAAGHWLSSSELASGAFTRENRAVALPEGYTHDDFGRVVASDAMAELFYDPEGRLRRVTQDGARILYAYSALGERVARVVDGRDDVTVYPTPRARDDGGERQSLVTYEGQPLALVVDERTTYGLLTDHLGVVEGVVAEDGNPLARWRFSPYGVLAPGAAHTAANLHSLELVRSFTGSLRDDATGLVHMGAREYLPETGSFTTPDPLFQSDPSLCTTRTSECAAYGYVAHDPINYVDPAGRARTTPSRSVASRAARVNGNSRHSAKAQHVYEIHRTDKLTGVSERYKYGISGGRVNKSGKSARAELQVRQLDRAAPNFTHRSQILIDVPAGRGARTQALTHERKLVYAQRAISHDGKTKPPGNKRP